MALWHALRSPEFSCSLVRANKVDADSSRIIADISMLLSSTFERTVLISVNSWFKSSVVGLIGICRELSCLVVVSTYGFVRFFELQPRRTALAAAASVLLQAHFDLFLPLCVLKHLFRANELPVGCNILCSCCAAGTTGPLVSSVPVRSACWLCLVACPPPASRGGRHKRTVGGDVVFPTSVSAPQVCVTARVARVQDHPRTRRRSCLLRSLPV